MAGWATAGSEIHGICMCVQNTNTPVYNSGVGEGDTGQVDTGRKGRCMNQAD